MKFEKHIAVPIEMFIYAQQNRYSDKLKFFFLLKLLYRNGKTKLNNEELLFIEFILQIKSQQTTKKHIQFLQEAGWIGYNSKTQFYILNSFDKIRARNDWNVRLAFPVDYSNYYKIQAITGAVIYSYLHKDFWRNVKRAKSVTLKGVTYHFLSPKFNYKEQPAPVSVNGVSKIFNISTATASRLKSLAYKEKLIHLQKNYSKETVNKEAMQLYCKYNDMNGEVVYHNKGYRLQLIDTVFPLFYFIKRKSL